MPRQTEAEQALVGFVHEAARVDPAARLLLRYGRLFAPSRSEATVRGPAGSCYQTAYRAVGRDGRWYTEGYALLSVGVPLPHAWVVTECGEAVDGTWQPPAVAYLGVPFAPAFLTEMVQRSHPYTVLEALARTMQHEQPMRHELRAEEAPLPEGAVALVGQPLGSG